MSEDWTPKPAPGWPHGVILYDGVCVFCSRWVRAVIARDRDRRFRFASIQSPYGQAFANAFGIDPDAPQTNAAVLDGLALFKSDAAIGVLSRLPRLGWTRAFGGAPRPVRDWLYDRIARNRYALFGKTETCVVPAPEDRARFLDDAAPPAAA